MPKSKISRSERLERYLVRIIQLPGADQNQPFPVRMLLGILKGISLAFKHVVLVRLFLYKERILHSYPLGCQVISVGNVTAGGTGKTPVVEIFARELHKRGRRVAILSRGYRKKELPWYRRFEEKYQPPRVVSDGDNILLDSEMGGDEPYMLASNLPGVVVLVDKNRVKSGKYAIKRFKRDILILDDGLQYQKLKHHVDVVLVDKTNPFGNGNILPRGVLREPAKNLKRADFIFISKSDGQSEELRETIARLNPSADVIECCHMPRFLCNVYSDEKIQLDWLRGRRVASLSGIAVPQSFESSLRKLGAKLISFERYADHHRYQAQEIIDAINKAHKLGAEALITTEKDAVRFPKLTRTAVPVYYVRVDIEIMAGAHNFIEAIDRIIGRIDAKKRS
ncbi:MAG: tetraacyldisaccharide 4'-kinase [Kiritimatiellia bacterium]